MMSGLFFCLSILVYKCIMDKKMYAITSGFTKRVENTDH